MIAAPEPNTVRGWCSHLARVLLLCMLVAAAHAADPAKTSDVYSGTVIEAIFEPLLTYDYLARPAKLVPNTAESLPLVTDTGRTYTFKLKKGIYFADDPAFKGRQRELTAEDYAYTIKR